jgi:hypothetical protein
MTEEIKENGTEIIESAEGKNNWEKNQKKDFYIEIILTLILGILIGVAVKTEALKKITIGSEDYKMKIFPNTYNLNDLEKELVKNQAEAQTTETANPQTVPADETAAEVN